MNALSKVDVPGHADDGPSGNNIEVKHAKKEETREVFEVPYSVEKEKQLLKILGHY